MSTDQSTLETFEQTEEKVYVTRFVSRGAAVYHTDRECQHITDNHKQIPLSAANNRGLDECKYCAGEINSEKFPPESERCGAPTTKDHPCRMHTLGGFDRCVRHLDFEEDGDIDESDDRPVWERQREKLLGDDDE